MSRSYKTARVVQSMNRVWRDSYNPLRGLTMSRAVSMMESAQRGLMADLQWCYGAESGIEATDPDLMAIIERTLSGVSDCEWEVALISEESTGFDKILAEEQAAFLRESYAQCDNLEDALEHLIMARFRGFSHLQPWFSTDWSLDHLEPLPQWNMVRNGTRGDWAWNPLANQTAYASQPASNRLTPDDYILAVSKRPINRIGLIKYVRATISEKDWDSYVETYGLPGVFIIMPERVPDGKQEEYAAKAEEAAEAASGALPYGSDVKTLSEVRGSQPFQMRLEWLQKQLVLAGTGGLLTMLSDASGGGAPVGVSAHSAVWDQIVRRVARSVSKLLHNQYDVTALAARFPGRPAQAYFTLRARQEKDVSKVVTNVTSLVNAGFDLDPSQVEKETGYTITAFNRSSAAPATPLGTFRMVGRSTPSDAKDAEALIRSGSDALAQAQAIANRPLALAIARVLTAPDFPSMQAAAKKLRDELPEIAAKMLSDPAQADAYNKIMSSAFLQGVCKETTK